MGSADLRELENEVLCKCVNVSVTLQFEGGLTLLKMLMMFCLLYFFEQHQESLDLLKSSLAWSAFVHFLYAFIFLNIVENRLDTIQI